MQKLPNNCARTLIENSRLNDISLMRKPRYLIDELRSTV